MIDGIDFAACTDVGLVRQNNEDSFNVMADDSQVLYVLVLADGMGGHNKGELASSIAVKYVSDNCIAKLDKSMSFSEMSTALRELVEKSNVKVFLASLEDSSYKGMGTTITAALIYKNSLAIAHIGDCRLYIYRNGELLQLTTDHTLVQALVDRGDLSKEEARNHRRKNLVTKALGSPEYVMADELSFKLKKQDIILMSSDGLHDYVEEDKMTAVLQNCSDVNSCAMELVELANRESGQDNVTVIVGMVR